MKQFSLEEYLKKPNRPVITRDGRKVRIICTNRKQRDVSYPIIALVGNEEGAEFTQSFTKDGKWYGEEAESNKDLFFEDYTPGKHEGWINLYRDCCSGVNYPGCRVFSTEEEAKKGLVMNDDRHIATIKIEWEE